MNRRELFQQLAGTLAAAGVTGVSAEALTAPTQPGEVLAIIRSDEILSHTMMENIAAQWKRVTQGTAWEGVRVLVLDRSLSLEIARLEDIGTKLRQNARRELAEEILAADARRIL